MNVCVLFLSLIVLSDPSEVKTDQQILTDQADQWDLDIIHKNLAAVADNMAEDFLQIRSDGALVDKQGFLNAVASPQLSINPYTVEDFNIRIFGTVALITGETRMTGRFGAEAFEIHYRFTDTYVKREGKWKVVQVQITPIRASED